MNSKMNSKISTISIITLLVMVGLGMISNTVSALTNFERYNVGWQDGMGHHPKTTHSNHVLTLNLLDFRHHTLAYQSGFISGLNQYYHTHLPYIAADPVTGAFPEGSGIPNN